METCFASGQMADDSYGCRPAYATENIREYVMGFELEHVSDVSPAYMLVVSNDGCVQRVQLPSESRLSASTGDFN